MFQKNALERLSNVAGSLSLKQQHLLQTHSVNNFLIFFDQLGHNDQLEVQKLIEAYLNKIETGDFLVDFKISHEIYNTFIVKVGSYYSPYLGFKFFDSSPLTPIIQGAAIDLLLFSFGALKYIYFIPICTLSLFMYWIYLKLFYVPKNKVFGARY